MGRSWWTRCSLCVEREAFISVNQRAMAPVHGGHITVVLWTSAASRVASCGGSKCTVPLSSLARQLALCAHSATQTCQEHLRLVLQCKTWTEAQSVGQHSTQTRQKPRRRYIRRTQVEETQGEGTTECRRRQKLTDRWTGMREGCAHTWCPCGMVHCKTTKGG